MKKMKMKVKSTPEQRAASRLSAEISPSPAAKSQYKLATFFGRGKR